MSHHLDSPTSRRDPRLNLTDTYVFDGEDATVVVMCLNSSLAGNGRVPGFHPEGRYEVKVHLDGGAVESLTYRVVFDPAGATGVQDLVVRRLTGADASDDGATGELVAQGRTGEVVQGDGVRVWAGSAADPFYLDLRQLAHILQGLQHEQPVTFGDWTPDAATSSFAGSQVYAVVLEVPHGDAELHPGRDVGVWCAAKLATDAGGWRQVNRAGIPMVWPLFRADGDADDSPGYLRATAGQPRNDTAGDEQRMSAWVAAAVHDTGVRDAAAYGRAVAGRLLPDVLPYRVGTPAAFTFAGFNGRSLADNAPEVVYALITNCAVPTGLRAASAAGTRQDTFPYLVPTA